MKRLMLNINEVIEQVGMSKSAIYNLIKIGKFPKLVKPTPNMSRWRSADIEL